MALDLKQLTQDIGTALVGSLKKSVPSIKEFAQSESAKLAQSLVTIEGLKLAGKIDEEEARLHLQIQKNASRIVLLTIEGLGVLAVETALNSALDVVKAAVNTALGFTLI